MFEHIKEIIGMLFMVGVAVGGVFVGRNRMVRRLSREKVEGAYDSAEISMLQKAINQAREAELRADQIAAERNLAMQELGQLRERIIHIERHRDECELRIAQIVKSYEERTKHMQLQIDRLQQNIETLLQNRGMS